MRMKRRWFTWHMNAYRLIVGAIVLAIILPASAAHLQAMWVVALACVLVVACAVVAGTRVPMIRNWLAPLTTLSAVAPVLILIRRPRHRRLGIPGFRSKSRKGPTCDCHGWALSDGEPDGVVRCLPLAVDLGLPAVSRS